MIFGVSVFINKDLFCARYGKVIIKLRPSLISESSSLVINLIIIVDLTFIPPQWGDHAAM